MSLFCLPEMDLPTLQNKHSGDYSCHQTGKVSCKSPTVLGTNQVAMIYSEKEGAEGKQKEGERFGAGGLVL